MDNTPSAEALLQAIAYRREIAERHSKDVRNGRKRYAAECAEKVNMLDSIVEQARELSAASKPAPAGNDVEGYILVPCQLMEQMLKTAAKRDGVSLIATERKRQVEQERWTPEHDDEHSDEELARAATCYVMPWADRETTYPPKMWPWDKSWWKPSPLARVRELVKAGALIAAEIDRLQRAALSAGDEQTTGEGK